MIDFGGGAKSVVSDIGDVQLVIFGDPRIGAAALSEDPMPALDLPAKVLVFRSADGTRLAYQRPKEMLAGWDVAADEQLMQRMADILENVTSAVKYSGRGRAHPYARHDLQM